MVVVQGMKKQKMKLPTRTRAEVMAALMPINGKLPTLLEIATRLGVASRQRAYQILTYFQIKTPHAHTPYSNYCCCFCGRHYSHHPKYGLCQKCGKFLSNYTFRCPVCGTVKTVRPFIYKRRTHNFTRQSPLFCSKSCYYIWKQQHPK